MFFLVIACQWIGATVDFIFIANAILVCIIEACTIAVQSCLRVGAGSVVIRCGLLEIAGRCVGATVDFIFIANAILVRIIEACTIAVQSCLRVGAGAVVGVGTV